MSSSERISGALTSFGAALLGVALFEITTRLFVPGARFSAVGLLALGLGLGALAVGARLAPVRSAALVPLALSGWGGFLVATVFADVWPALVVPYDLVSFAESPYVNDVIKWRIGAPLYGPAGNNDSYPYTPGAPLLTHALASLWGAGDSVAGMRLANFAYVIAAGLVAAMAARRVARDASREAVDVRWLAWFVAVCFLAASEREFNPYVHSLHNDSLALLVCACGLWLVTSERNDAFRPLHFAATLALPVAGFFVKQSMLVWIGLFAIARVAMGVPFRRAVGGAAASTALAALAIAAAAASLGDDFVYWIFRALGDKQVSPARSVLHFLHASPWLGVGLASLWALWGVSWRATAPSVRGTAAVFFVMFSIQSWTSGIGWAVNHLGPSVLFAAALAAAAVPLAFPRFAAALSRNWGVPAALVAVAFVTIWLGLVRIPAPGPPSTEIAAHAAAIEREFAGLPADEVLMDNGSWIYLRAGVVMRDRSSPVALHAGMNQALRLEALRNTLERLRGGVYRKLLVHDISTDPGLQSWYDFQDRGTGIVQVIEQHYRLVRRIPGARARYPSWMTSLGSEVLVYERRAAAADDTLRQPMAPTL